MRSIREGGRRQTIVRGAAIGLFAIIVGGSGLTGSTSATVTSGERTVFVPIVPCRLFDTRAGVDNVGSRSTPIGSNETFVAQVVGTNGGCVMPVGAVGVSLNVTVTNPSAASFLTVFPSDVSRPLASSLNWVAGQAPTPNAMTVALSADGKASFYNLTGTVDVLVDIVGYYEDHHFDDRYYTKGEVDAKVMTEVVSSVGLFVPDPLVPTVNYSSVNETVETTKAGHWLVTKSFIGDLDCTPATTAYYFLVVDGVPLRSSAITRGASGPNQYFDDLIGMTPESIDAGTHTIGVAGQCPAGSTTTGTGVTGSSIASVMVLP